MRGVAFAGLVLIFCSGIMGQAFDPTTPDGSMIASIQKTSDAAQKTTLLEQFVQQFPDSHMAAWAWAQLQGGYLQAQQYDKALTAGEKSLVGDPAATEVAYNNLKAAEGKNDPDAVMKWAAETSRIARAEAGKSAGDRSRVDYAKQVDTYSEYSVYATSLKVTDPAKIIQLTESLEQRNPDSPYLSKAYGRYLAALRQAGHADKVGAAAEREAKRDPLNEDVLLVAAQSAMEQKDYPKELTYASKAAEVMQTKAKPEEIADADWQKKKETTLGVSLWMQGIGYNSTNRYAEADKALRSALPLVKTDNRLLPMVLFQLGVSDFQMGKASKNPALVRDALKYSQQSAAMKSPVQAEAQNNVRAITRALGGAR